jgi:molybdate transport system substrate-binding protein
VGGLLAAALLLAAPGMSRAAAENQEGTIVVFAAASLKNALDEVAAAYRAATGRSVNVSYAASSALAKQIEQGAPAAVFMSADLDWMDYLETRGLIVKETRSSLLGNSLVLIAAKDSTIGEVALRPGLDLAGLLGPDGRLATADVTAVPAGKYARAALEKLGAWRGVEGRLAQAENVRAALAFVSRGEAPLGIVYKTDAAADPNVRVIATFPGDSHPPIVYPVALTAGAAGAAGAEFLTYLRKAPAARSAFEKQGFTLIGTPAS